MKTKLYLLLLFITACSTTRNLPEDETLYTGMKKTVVENRDISLAGDEALDEVNAALAAAPNNSLLGSSSVRYPFPFGLWMYNAFYPCKKGLGHWMFNRLASTPVLISTVNPEVRVKVARNLLRDYGYFNGQVSYELIPGKKRQAKLKYKIDMQQPYLLDTIIYTHYSSRTDSLLQQRLVDKVLHKGDHFSVLKLDEERQRLSGLLRNAGYYYFRPELIIFLADTIQRSGRVSLKITPKAGLPTQILRSWNIGKRNIILNGFNGETPTDSLNYKDLTIFYQGKLRVRPLVLYNRFKLMPGELYSQRKQLRTLENMNRLGIFKYTEMQFIPRDTTASNNLLDVWMNAAYDLPLDGELELNVTSKSNDQAGPGAAFTLSKRNVFGGGENFTVKLKGSYEWQTNAPVAGSSSVVNSYELGVSATLAIPRLVLPGMGYKELTYPATTTFRLYADQLNRARYFKLLSFGGNATYDFQSSRVSRHSVTPFKLTFNVLQYTTQRFDSVTNANPALYLSLKNQFIPAMNYTYTYDDAVVRSKRNHIWWETSVTSAGNITSGIYRLFGRSFNEEKKLLGNPFAQFLKLTSEVRYTYKINARQFLVSRLSGGILYAYGNSEVAPYNEQFYIGGANSLRAFTIRSLGPGSYRPDASKTYSYMDQTGNFKLEANIEYRFNLLGNLNGAIFLDAGNIWLLKKDEFRPGGQFNLSRLGKDIALGTGAGLRYDFSYLVIRLDAGIGLHAPYTTYKTGYYNIPTFKDGLGIHLAIGYPF
ncbi:BamA/TamA family outer membrane protein [uncultured Bacteroides sp.]|uniref:translocation and assembly module lipoprotein TamL n=1 Tax=uncultured Bacteroides sp. TaxID=162156 RepID=UPI002AAB6213|nr:BamA/TamA family outer membrane protein [uncultured Bacteroides sp.]